MKTWESQPSRHGRLTRPLTWILLFVLLGTTSADPLEQQCRNDGNPNDKNCLIQTNETISYPKMKNAHQFCDFWANEGECSKNPNYMRETCFAACYTLELKKSKSTNNECTLYMAESSIPNSGWGMYSAVEIAEKELIPQPEILMNVVDFSKHRRLAKRYEDQKNQSLHLPEGVMNDQNPNCDAWARVGECEANPVYMKQQCQRSCYLMDKRRNATYDDEDDEEEDEFWLPDNYFWDSDSPGTTHEAAHVETLIPGVGALANSHTGLVNTEMLYAKVDGAGLYRDSDPGAGAISPYHDMSYSASKKIQPGEEIFAEYGDNWFEVRESKFGTLPLSDDFEHGDKILDNLSKTINDKSSPLAEKLLTFTREVTNSNKRVRMIIPGSMDEFQAVQNAGGTARYTVPNAIRPLEWLKEKGICLDNIVAAPSTIKGAGRGAFATRPIQRGQIIAPAPLMHVHRDNLKMYGEGNLTEGVVPIEDQLIRNYCFGHVDSPVLFFSYGPVVNFINHNSNPDLINAKIQWATEGRTKAGWMELSLDALFEKESAGIMLEFVATRDIGVLEEIFIDYGSAWQTEWDHHVSKWEKEELGDYVYDLIKLNEETTELLTKSELQKKPYPRNAMTLCFITADIWESEEDIVDFDDYETDDSLNMRESIACDVIDVVLGEEEDEDDYYYTVDVKRTSDPKQGKKIVNFPRNFIKITHKPYSRDYTLPNRFRHEIGIPGDIFPHQWIQGKRAGSQNQSST